MRKQSQGLDLKMNCEELCGHHHEGSLQHYTDICNTFLMNFICPRGCAVQIHFKAHWFQNVKKCSVNQGNFSSSSGYNDKFSRLECDVLTSGISTGGRSQEVLGSVLAQWFIICLVSRKFFSQSQSLIFLIHKIGIKQHSTLTEHIKCRILCKVLTERILNAQFTFVPSLHVPCPPHSINIQRR